MTPLALCEWLETTALAILIQESLYGFPITVAVHILGLTLSVGTLLWVDLRMLGLTFTRVPLNEIYRGLAPWFGAGFVLMFLSGSALFTAFATSAYGNTYFRIKMLLLVLAGVNAAVFHALASQPAGLSSDTRRPPVAVRVAGVVSLSIWAAVIVSGRMMSYTMF